VGDDESGVNTFSRPSIVCRCGRVFFDGEDVWAHVRAEHASEQAKRRAMDEMQRLICDAPVPR
jgi:hypothetical protein